MNVGLIFAGGVGSRMKSDSMPKQFLELDGKPIIIYTLEIFEQNRNIDQVIVVCKEEWIEYLESLLSKFNIKKVLSVISGGKTAQESQYRGLLEIKQRIVGLKDCIVLIHDGVRPLINDEVINDNINSVKKYGATITVSPAIETVVYIDDKGKVSEVLERSNCRMAKAPQSFWFEEIMSSHKRAIEDNNHKFIDSASLMQYYGFSLSTVEGEPENIKITTPADFYMFKALIEARKNEKIFS
ncbi:IspD/TarI family cytidylyltransferase [Enterococcus caccae]|uniref:Ribitol-5-phosphate cytidylyltransferase n=1 Tax=Enterococcus caccae ATCC BAA-1240 TaxID=1158612 RepID=R3X5R3_9ENTE|nr:IspD/TarI family cytidylyltransferase [Enterococcus caccae]EOL49390.1 2-C-methyl-D-erythritol 4-phosphate cytidylyltransferase [Enterococcus caccae ATCC BAA-1240]EOT56442.1 2-C-methyl-D-erythritol 4-phosphate cytidylyltransferase [Enterococcus caccae ATCC BAA-1240]OJG25253.1 2-C-methyl-D-erythritol 4-phosphate cytidylyltransferase [Enterococcus caccae]